MQLIVKFTTNCHKCTIYFIRRHFWKLMKIAVKVKRLSDYQLPRKSWIKQKNLYLNAIETVNRFLLHCKAYSNIRRRIVHVNIYSFFYSLNSEGKLVTLTSDDNCHKYHVCHGPWKSWNVLGCSLCPVVPWNVLEFLESGKALRRKF